MGMEDVRLADRPDDIQKRIAQQYAKRGAPAWPRLLSVLVPYNQAWATAAAALIFVVSSPSFTPSWKSEPTVSRSALFDAGAAWASLKLQAFLDGWVAHGMGFGDEAARAARNVPEDHRIDGAAAIGWPGDKAALPERYHLGKTPNNRRPTSEFVFEGAFPAAL